MGDETLMLVKDHFDEQINRIDMGWDNRFKALENNMNDHFGSCRDLCTTKILNAVEKVDKAHARLDSQKKAIECLCAHKNNELGFQRAVFAGMTLMALVIAYIGLK